MFRAEHVESAVSSAYVTLSESDDRERFADSPPAAH